MDSNLVDKTSRRLAVGSPFGGVDFADWSGVPSCSIRLLRLVLASVALTVPTAGLDRVMNRLFLAIALCLVLASCEDDYTSEARAAFAQHGAIGGDEFLLSRARGGAGRDLYIYDRFLLLYGHLLPPTRPFGSADAEAFLNCAASRGLNEAIEFGRGHLSALHTPAATSAIQCMNARLQARHDEMANRQAWSDCGAENILPRCPISAPGPAR
jgi:hypothetical protein